MVIPRVFTEPLGKEQCQECVGASAQLLVMVGHALLFLIWPSDLTLMA